MTLIDLQGHFRYHKRFHCLYVKYIYDNDVQSQLGLLSEVICRIQLEGLL